MPFAAKTACRGCGAAVHGGWCDACRAAGKAKDQRPSSTARLYGIRWQKATNRNTGWLKSHPAAVDWFGEHGDRVYGSQVVDHIVAHKGDLTLFWDPANWQGLTKRDHDRKTGLENGSAGRWVNAGTAERIAMRWVRTGMGGPIPGDPGR